MRTAWPSLSALLCLLLTSCDAPGPLKAERDVESLYAPEAAGQVVVEAILIVDRPLPPVTLRGTVAPGEVAWDASPVTGATVRLEADDETFVYRDNPDDPGRYRPVDTDAVVAPDRSYRLRVVTATGVEVGAETHTPQRLRIVELALLDKDPLLEEDREVELRRLRLFAEAGEGVYQAPENQLEYTRGVLKIGVAPSAGAASYRSSVTNLEPSSPLLIDSDFVDEDDVGREETSPLVRLDEDRLFLPWFGFGIAYAGRNKIRLYAVDRNWFDLVRTDNIDAERGGQAGESFQRPLFHVDNGIGLFGSASVDSVGFFVRGNDSPPCTGCQCWGCRSSRWEGRLSLAGRGSVRFVREVAGGDNCDLTYAIDGARTVAPCQRCAFGWDLPLGWLHIDRDEGGCGKAADLSGLTVRLAHGLEGLGESESVPEYRLWEGEGDDWTPIETGWSRLPEDGEDAGWWLFGFEDD